MRIDAHTHIETKKETESPLGHIEVLIQNMNKNKIDKVIAFQLGDSYQGNIDMMEQIKSYDDRIIPFAFINPKEDNASNKLLYCLEELKMKGVKLHPLVHKFDIADFSLMNEIYEICNERKLHVIIHCTSNETLVDCEKIELVAKKYKNMTIQLAHMGAIYDGKKAVKVAKRNTNVYLDTGIASFSAITRAIKEVPEKIVMGTDYPMYMFEIELTKLKCACDESGNTQAFDWITGGTISKLLGLEDAI